MLTEGLREPSGLPSEGYSRGPWPVSWPVTHHTQNRTSCVRPQTQQVHIRHLTCEKDGYPWWVMGDDTTLWPARSHSSARQVGWEGTQNWTSMGLYRKGKETPFVQPLWTAGVTGRSGQETIENEAVQVTLRSCVHSTSPGPPSLNKKNTFTFKMLIASWSLGRRTCYPSNFCMELSVFALTGRQKCWH